jgi:hypothetical protein
VPANQLDQLEERHRQLVRLLIEINAARGQIDTEQGQASKNTTIAASFAAIMVVTDILRITVSAVDERADFGFKAIDKIVEHVNVGKTVTGKGGIATTDDAMAMLDGGLANSSRLIGFVQQLKSYFDDVKKAKNVKLSPTAEQIGTVADVGLAMTQGFMLLYGTLRAGQDTISSGQAARNQANAFYNVVFNQIVQVKAQMDQIAEIQSKRESLPHQNFPKPVQYAALGRQKHRCASCGHKIHDIGKRGQADHHFGEGATAHHIIPHLMGGPLTIENCAVICEACHINAHQGGHWAGIKIYDDLAGLPMNEKIRRIASQYPHYRG